LLRLEVDVCSTSDEFMVLRHDTTVTPANVVNPSARIPTGTRVADLSLADLRRLDPALLTLDEAVEVLDGRVPLLLDIKGDATAGTLGDWLSRRRNGADFAACTENRDALLHLRFAAPRTERWPSFPDIGDQRAGYVRRVLHELWLGHRDARHLGGSLVEIGRAVEDARNRPRNGVARLAGLPWRNRLPRIIAERSAEVGAAALCIQHWLITPEICAAAEKLGLPVTAWTVNDPAVARRVVDCGVQRITADNVDLLRCGLRVAGPALGLHHL